jgi:hypothetical protein
MKGAMKEAYKTRLQNEIGHKSTKPVSNEPKGKFKIGPILVALFLVLGVAAMFAFIKK